MQNLNSEEIEAVSGGGIFDDIVDSILDAFDTERKRVLSGGG